MVMFVIPAQASMTFRAETLLKETVTIDPASKDGTPNMI
jgi:hypothetical protein